MKLNDEISEIFFAEILCGDLKVEENRDTITIIAVDLDDFFICIDIMSNFYLFNDFNKDIVNWVVDKAELLDKLKEVRSAYVEKV